MNKRENVLILLKKNKRVKLILTLTMNYIMDNLCISNRWFQRGDIDII